MINQSNEWLDKEGIEKPFSLKQEVAEHGEMKFIFKEGKLGTFNDNNVMHYTVQNLRDNAQVTFMTQSIAVIAGLADAKEGDQYEIEHKALGGGKSTYTVTKSGAPVGMGTRVEDMGAPVDIPVIEQDEDVPF